MTPTDVRSEDDPLDLVERHPLTARSYRSVLRAGVPGHRLCVLQEAALPRLAVLAVALVLAAPAATACAEVPAELLTLDHWLVQLRCREPAASADRLACYRVAGRMLAAATRRRRERRRTAAVRRLRPGQRVAGTPERRVRA